MKKPAVLIISLVLVLVVSFLALSNSKKPQVPSSPTPFESVLNQNDQNTPPVTPSPTGNSLDTEIEAELAEMEKLINENEYPEIDFDDIN